MFTGTMYSNDFQNFLSASIDLDYCNKKFDHLPRVIDMCIAMAGRATGLKKMSKLKLKLENFYLKYLFINNFKKH